jgi:hypothetical protein
MYDKDKKEIILKRESNKLDDFVMDFTSELDNYVIVSGYVSILLGRSRATEDVDLLIPKISLDNFEKLWKKIYNAGFECINTSKINEAFDMLKEVAIRFARKGKAIPNIEFKIIKNDLDEYSFDNKIKVIMNKGILFISNLEMQIAYKLFLGSEKDLEDSKHLYKLFKEKIDKQELLNLIIKLKVEKRFELIK